MDQPNSSNHWRQMFERDPRGVGQRAPDASAMPPPRAPAYDDGFVPPASDAPPSSPESIIDETAMALALDAPDYRPWILQRGRTRPSLMLHLRRFDSRARQWTGWIIAYPHLLAAEYCGSNLVALDFGARQFMLEGEGFSELIDHLQSGHVLCLQEYAPSVWADKPNGPCISAIRLAGNVQP